MKQNKLNGRVGDVDVTDEDLEFARIIARRGVGALVMRVLETIGRFVQYKFREMDAKGIKVDYTLDYKKYPDEWVLIVKARVPDWFIEEIVRKRYGYIRQLKKMGYAIRRAEAVMYKWPRFDKDVVMKFANEVAQEIIDEHQFFEELGGAGGGEEEDRGREELPVDVEIEFEGIPGADEGEDKSSRRGD